MAQPANSSSGAILRVAFVTGVTPGKWAKVWTERMPGADLELIPASPSEAFTAVSTGAADVALVRLPFTSDGFSAIPLYSELPVVVVPRAHAFEAVAVVSPADLSAETVVSNDMHDGDWERAVERVASGAGVAVMPQSVARALSRRDVISRPMSGGAESRIAVTWLAGNTSPLVEEFIGIVRGRTANSSRGVAGSPPVPKSQPKRQRKPDRSPSRRR